MYLEVEVLALLVLLLSSLRSSRVEEAEALAAAAAAPIPEAEAAFLSVSARGGDPTDERGAKRSAVGGLLLLPSVVIEVF